ncbi:hypothetical protein SAY86_011998 [Trapa natans]|uniref:Transcription factor MYB39 n=1 Tax=Trapa natans TaxID=22666 RepID=A0AAN7LXC5_TRANT|nr:hypothetical protein SAY86_011998 [Trapa natans]
MGRPPSPAKDGVKKGPWDAEEDKKLVDFIAKHGPGCWISLPKLAGLNRCGKSCRLRWINYLRPDLKRGNFTAEEEQKILRLHEILGNKWSAIAMQLPGRTDNEIKNYWNTHLKKRLIRMGYDPMTHEPRTDLMACLTILAMSTNGLNDLLNRTPLDVNAVKLDYLKQMFQSTDAAAPNLVSSISAPLLEGSPILNSLPQLENQEAAFSLGATTTSGHLLQPLHHSITTALSASPTDLQLDPQPTFPPSFESMLFEGTEAAQSCGFFQWDDPAENISDPWGFESASEFVPSFTTQTDTPASNPVDVTSCSRIHCGDGTSGRYSPWTEILFDHPIIQ